MLPVKPIHRQNGAVTFHSDGVLPISEAVAAFSSQLPNPGNYPRIVRRYLEELIEKGYSINEVSFAMYAAGKKGNRISPVKKFLHFAKSYGLTRVVPDPPHKELPPAMNAYILAFLADKTTLRGEHSRQTYLTALNRFFAFLPQDTFSYDGRTVEDFVRFLKGEEKSAFTINNYLSVVKSFTKWLLKRREMLQLPLTPRQMELMRDVDDIAGLPIEGRYFKEDLSDQERKMLLDGIEDSRVKAMVALMAYCGLRTVELTRLKVADLDFARNRVLVLGKGQATKRWAKLFKEAKQAVKSYIDSLPKGEREVYLFPDLTTRKVRYYTDKYLKEMELKRAGVSCHSLRHTAAQRLLDKGADLLHVKNQLGHKQLSTTQVYVEKQAQQSYLDQLPE